jgi:hypothetical protein
VPAFYDPGALSPDEQLLELVTIFAAGILRLHRPLQTQELGPEAPDASRQKSLESHSNQLDVPPGQSVTVHAG